MRESGANPLFVQPLVCGHTPVSNEERDGAQTGCVTYAWLKPSIPRRDCSGSARGPSDFRCKRACPPAAGQAARKPDSVCAEDGLTAASGNSWPIRAKWRAVESNPPTVRTVTKEENAQMRLEFARHFHCAPQQFQIIVS